MINEGVSLCGMPFLQLTGIIKNNSHFMGVMI